MRALVVAESEHYRTDSVARVDVGPGYYQLSPLRSLAGREVAVDATGYDLRREEEKTQVVDQSGGLGKSWTS